MDFAYSPEDQAFRDELRAWLDENLPEVPRRLGRRRRSSGGGRRRRAASTRTQERRKDWQRRLQRGPVGRDQLAQGLGRARGHAGPERHLLRGDGAACARRASTTPTASGRSAR